MRICVPVAEEYPNTDLAAFCRGEKDACFAQLNMTLADLGRLEKSVTFSVNRRHLPWTGADYDEVPNILFLHAFYVHGSKSSPTSDIATQGEKAMLRGMGKKMLCEAVKLIIAEHDLDVKNTYVVAEADGADQTKVNAMLKSLDNVDERDMIYLLFKKYPSELQRLSGYEVDREDIAYAVAASEANASLICYYKKTFGFELWQRSVSTGALMGARVDVVLTHCN